MRVTNKCCRCPCLSAAITKWNGEESRKPPHPYWPWLPVNKSWSIAHEARLWQRSTHWAEFTEINISLPNTHLPCATIYNLCHSCSTSWHSASHAEGSSFSLGKLHRRGEWVRGHFRDTLSTVTNLWIVRWLWMLIGWRAWGTIKPPSWVPSKYGSLNLHGCKLKTTRISQFCNSFHNQPGKCQKIVEIVTLSTDLHNNPLFYDLSLVEFTADNSHLDVRISCMIRVYWRVHSHTSGWRNSVLTTVPT